ncbi:MAG: ACT domain-containing protein, partial [Oscillospiraceae bacterium]|nr:ACT domain-containing protein [Oscillospiraceae bacterium]
MLIKQISIFVENKPGRLSNITNILKNNNIDIRALSIADTKDFG